MKLHGLRIERYLDEQKNVWDDFVDRSKNGTFLFRRDYMDYHRHRFSDHSLIVYDEGHVAALLPANRQGARIVSHGGLTFGGFLIDDAMTASRMLAVLTHTCETLRHDGFEEILLKPVPHIYCRRPAEEFNYAVFRCGGQLYRRDVTTALIPAQNQRWQERRDRSLKKARAAGVVCRQSEDFSAYWEILSTNLKESHNLTPVHTVEEICGLHGAFPRNIKLFCAFLMGEMVAGVLIYDAGRVAHAQYTASSQGGRACGALDLLFHYLLAEIYPDKPYFDFGVSTENEGLTLNEGLVAFKEGFGGRTITHDFFRIAL